MKIILVLFFTIFMLVSCGSENFEDDCDPNAGAEVCDVFFIVNQERKSLSLPRLTWNAELAAAADAHAADMQTQGYFDHVSKNGRTFSQRAEDAEYDAFPTGENIAQGQKTAKAVMNAWMTSNGHRRNILSVQSNEIGVGLRGNFWVQVFGKR